MKTSIGSIELRAYGRSPRLAEIRAVYKSRIKASERKDIRGPESVIEYLREIWDPRTLELTEDFVILCLNGSHQILGWVRISRGGLGSSLVDPRVIFAIALQTASSALVLAHNHPSGNLEPSPEDRRVTDHLIEAGKLLNIRVLDHVILTREGAFSFQENGLIG